MRKGMIDKMECRHAEIAELEANIEQLYDVLKWSTDFSNYNGQALEVLNTLQGESYTATESENVQQDIRIMPSMTDLIVSSHANVVKEINMAIKEMTDDLEDLRHEDEEYHKMVENDS